MKAMTVPRSGARFTPVLHEEVVEIERIHSTVRRCMCKRCGLTWEDTITSRQTLIESQEAIDNLSDYFPEWVSCTDKSAWTNKKA